MTYIKHPNRRRHSPVTTDVTIALSATWDDVKALDTAAAMITDELLGQRLQGLSNRLTFSLDLAASAKTFRGRGSVSDNTVLRYKALQAWTYWRDNLYPRRKEPTEEAMAVLVGRVEEGLDLGEWMQIVDWAVKDEWMNGTTSGVRYQELSTLAGSRDRIEKYLARSDTYFMLQARDGVEVYPYHAVAFNEPPNQGVALQQVN